MVGASLRATAKGVGKRLAFHGQPFARVALQLFMI
jgi:hypothetical protein